MTIGEIAKQTDLPESTLRYYEKKWEEYLENLDKKIGFYEDAI